MTRSTARFGDNSRAMVSILSLIMAFIAAGLAPADRAWADPATPVVEVTNLGLALPNSAGSGLTLVLLEGGLTTDLRPSDIGCSRLCKPCTTLVCLDGEWKPQEITFPERLCAARGDLDPPFKTCPRTSTGFCPAECHICF